MSTALKTYLHHHLAGSKFAVELLEGIKENRPDEQLGYFAEGLLVEIIEDRNTLEGIIQRVGAAHVDLKQAAAWLTEKVSELRLRGSSLGSLGTLEALETLALGISGKRALWRLLQASAVAQPALHGENYEALLQRAEDQHARVEAYRLKAGQACFGRSLTAH